MAMGAVAAEAIAAGLEAQSTHGLHRASFTFSSSPRKAQPVVGRRRTLSGRSCRLPAGPQVPLCIATSSPKSSSSSSSAASSSSSSSPSSSNSQPFPAKGSGARQDVSRDEALAAYAAGLAIPAPPPGGGDAASLDYAPPPSAPDEDAENAKYTAECCQYPRQTAGTRAFDFRRVPEVRGSLQMPTSLSDFGEKESNVTGLQLVELWIGRAGMLAFSFLFYAYWGSLVAAAVTRFTATWLMGDPSDMP